MKIYKLKVKARNPIVCKFVLYVHIYVNDRIPTYLPLMIKHNHHVNKIHTIGIKVNVASLYIFIDLCKKMLGWQFLWLPTTIFPHCPSWNCSLNTESYKTTSILFKIKTSFLSTCTLAVTWNGTNSSIHVYKYITHSLISLRCY